MQVGSATKLVQELNAAGHRTKRGKPFDKGIVYKLPQPQLCRRGRAQGRSYPGQHEAIVDRDTWDKVHAILAESATGGAAGRARRRLRCSRA